VAALLAADQPFPCTFAVAAARHRGLRFGFVDDLSRRATWQALPAVLGAYLDRYQALGRETSLVVFFGDSGPAPSLDDYFRRFWSVLQFLHDGDRQPWPARVPADPGHPLWEFSFAGTEIFVVCGNPAYRARRSRHNERFMITFQPRWVFEGLGANSPRGAAARRVIRGRLKAFDGQPPAPELGSYGDPGNREWRQYFLADRNDQSPAGCPFQARLAPLASSDHPVDGP
jgi:FPC/CPF motif-containing protein YcgG